jgi:hypothetical protein
VGTGLASVGLAVTAAAWTFRAVMTALYGWPPPVQETLRDRAVQAIPFFASSLIPFLVVVVIAMAFFMLPFRSWKPASLASVVSYLTHDMESLPAHHRIRLEKISVEPRRIPVDSAPGETVVVVAAHEDRVVYWSDIEEGWEVDRTTSSGGIAERGANQYELRQLTWQLFGPPPA